MTWTVLKYKLGRSLGVVDIEMPVTSEILCIKVQRGMPTLWIRTPSDVSPAMCTRQFLLLPTGGEAAGELKHLDTVLLADDSYVIHIFEVP